MSTKLVVIQRAVEPKAKTSEQSIVLSASDGLILQSGQRIETGTPQRIIYHDVPQNLRDRPTLVMTLSNNGATQHEVELSYLATGLGWQADYVVELNPNDDKLDLSGWVTLTNTSGATYSNAQLQLVAGDVNRVPVQLIRPAVLAMQAPAPTNKSSMAEEALFEYHLYSLNRPTTIADNQVKQVSLLSATGVIVRKDLVLQGSSHYYQSNAGNSIQKNKVDVYLEFENKESSNLGIALPKGIVRVYKKDSLGHAQFVGEDRLSHTPKDVEARLKMGAAFDVTDLSGFIGPFSFRNEGSGKVLG